MKGRWEIVAPGDELPTSQDLLTEATLPVEVRGLQRRYPQLERFNLFLPPTGRAALPGPETARLPTGAAGTYLILLRIEASDDKEADSDLSKVGAGPGVVHSGAVAGFSLPVLRYVVGGDLPGRVPQSSDREVALLLPDDNSEIVRERPIVFTWLENAQAAVYRIDIHDSRGVVLSALVPAGTGVYRPPPWVQEHLEREPIRWRVVELDVQGRESRMSDWRTVAPRR